MEPFKIALKIAIDQKADKISFVEGRLPVMWKSDKEIAINHQPIVQKILLSQLFASFFPGNQDKLVEGQPVQGPLKVVDVGNLILLAIPGKPAALNVYFPGDGEQYFADDWRSLARVRNAEPQIDMPAAAPAAVPPPPPVASPASQPSEFQPPAQGNSPSEAPAATTTIKPQPPTIPADIFADEPSLTTSEKLDTTSDPNINFGQTQIAAEPVPDPHGATGHRIDNSHQTQGFCSLDVSEVKPIVTEPPAPKQKKPLGRPKGPRPAIAVSGKNIDSLLATMADESFDQLVLSCDQKAAFFDRAGMVLSDEVMKGQAINSALETLFPEALAKGKDAPGFFHRWHNTASQGGYRLHGSFGNGKPWLSVVKKDDPLSHSAKELLIPEGITDLAWLDRGLVIIAGEQNSGKSTTAHHLIDRMNRHRNRNILIVQNEDAARHQADKSCIRKQCTARWPEDTGAPCYFDQDPADTLIVDSGFQPFLVAPVLKAVNQGKLVFWVLPGQSGGEALFDLLRYLAGENMLYLATKLLGRLEAVISQTILTSAEHLPVPLFEAWHLSDQHRRWLKEQWQSNLSGGETSLFQLLGPAPAAPGISFEKSILGALSIGAISPAAVRSQFFDKERVDKLFADAGISSLTPAGDLLDDASLAAS